MDSILKLSEETTFDLHQRGEVAVRIFNKLEKEFNTNPNMWEYRTELYNSDYAQQVRDNIIVNQTF